MVTKSNSCKSRKIMNNNKNNTDNSYITLIKEYFFDFINYSKNFYNNFFLNNKYNNKIDSINDIKIEINEIKYDLINLEQNFKQEINNIKYNIKNEMINLKLKNEINNWKLKQKNEIETEKVNSTSKISNKNSNFSIQITNKSNDSNISLERIERFNQNNLNIVEPIICKPKEYNCKECIFTTNNPSKLDKHIKDCNKFNKKNDFKCIKCNFSTKFKFLFNIHKENCINNNTNLKCRNCSLVFNNYTLLLIHEYDCNSNKKKYICKFCDLKFEKSYYLASHVSRCEIAINEKKINSNKTKESKK